MMRREMAEQPDVLARLVQRRADTVNDVRRVAPRDLAGVVLIARGSSDNAALAARYLFELATGRPAALAAPSLWTRYGARTDLTNWVAVAVSQSGRTPEILDTMMAMKARGAVTVSVSNDPDSPLSQASDAAVGLAAGDERAVPATKTVTASLLALVHLAAGLGELGWDEAAERAAVAAVDSVLDNEDPVVRALDRLGGATPVHLGRGFSLPVAHEAALKAKETTTKGARGYASADFLHGPVAAVGTGSAVVGWALRGPTCADVTSALDQAAERGAATVLSGDSRASAGSVHEPMPVPAGLPEPLAALPLLVRAQQLALLATLRAGLDPDSPPGLSKVTATD